MRVGSYEQRRNPALAGYPRHRIVIPVFVPELEGYFAHALEVLELCLRSLHATIGSAANVTVIANGCAPPVVAWLEARRERFDQLVINRANRGKVDAAVGAARACFEPLITVADGDVLFLPGWVRAVERIFVTFPECGAATPAPNPRHAWSHTSATVLGAWARRELRWARVVPEQDLRRFAASIGREDFFTDRDYERQLVVTRDGLHAPVGCGHFALTLRREVLAAMPAGPSLKAVTGLSEERWLDHPPDRLGLWRLATDRAYVHHIGNRPEPWMREAAPAADGEADAAATADVADAADAPLPPPRRGAIARLPRRLRAVLARVLKRGLRP